MSVYQVSNSCIFSEQFVYSLYTISVKQVCHTQDQAAFTGCFTRADSRSVDQSSSLWIITCMYCVMYVRCVGIDSFPGSCSQAVVPGPSLRPGNEATLCSIT